jgi:hypothetical protein
VIRPRRPRTAIPPAQSKAHAGHGPAPAKGPEARSELSVPTIDFGSLEVGQPRSCARRAGTARSERQNRPSAPIGPRNITYRMIVRRDGLSCRLYTRNAYDRTGRLRRSRLLPSGSKPGDSRWTVRWSFWRLTACRSSTGCPEGRPHARCAFDLTGHVGKDLRNCAFLDHKRQVGANCRRRGILLNEHLAEDRPIVFEPVSLGAEGIVFRLLEVSIRAMVRPGPAVQRGRSGNWNRV